MRTRNAADRSNTVMPAIMLALCLLTAAGGVVAQTRENAPVRRGGATYVDGGASGSADAQLRLRFDHLRVEQGLSQGSISCILQDAKGYLWVGTDDGLNRFDGYQFIVFRPDPKHPHSLASNVVTALAEDRNGDIWIGTGGVGFQRMSPSTREFTTPSQTSSDRSTLAASVITALQVDRRQRIWIGTERDGLHVYDPSAQSLRAVDLSDDGSRAPITAITSTRSGRILVAAHRKGLFIVEEDGFVPRRLALPSGIAAGESRNGGGAGSDAAVLQVLVEADRYIWIATEEGVVARHDVRTGSWSQIRLATVFPDGFHGAVPTMAMDGEERIWMGTRSRGLILLDTRRRTLHAITRNPLDPEALPGNSIRCVYRDRLGNMWIGTNGMGLGLHSPAAKEFNLVAPGTHGTGRLPVHSFRAIWQGRDSVLWLGGYGGFCRIDRRGSGVLCSTDPLSSHATGRRGFSGAPVSTVFSVLPDPEAPEDVLLVGTEGSGLYRLDMSTLRFTHLWPLPSDSVRSENLMIFELALTRDGSVWIGTEEGLYRWERSQRQSRPRPVAKADFSGRQGNVLSVYEDRNGFLWIGTEHGGLAYYDRLEDQVTFFRHRRGQTESIASNNVRCILEDSRGLLWIGTSAGLDLMDDEKGTFRHITTDDGLPNNVVYGILEDVSGYLWLSTNRGLARYHPDEGVVATYDVHDGLQGNEFNTSAFFQSASGELFFGGVRGVTHFYPERITRNLTTPPVVITGVRAGNRELLLRNDGIFGDTVIVDHNSESIGLSFAALSFYRPEKNQYRYRIAGRSDEFIDLGTDRFLSFAGLSPGVYVIQIQGSNNDGNWNLQGATLTLIVQPPFWGSWWFRFVAALLVLAVALLLIRWRLHRLRSQERMLAGEVAHRTSELQHANTKLLSEIEERKRAEADAYRANATKSEFLAHISHEIRTPMNAILGFTELLQDRIHEEEQRNYLNSIAVSGRTLLTLINDMLDLSKIEAGKLELSYHPTSIRAITEEIEQLFAYQVQQKRLTFTVSIDPGVPRTMYLDEIRIRQILLNLVGNAVKFTAKGTISLDVSCMRTDAQRCTMKLRLTDTGVGIAPSQQERIFEPFRQGGRGRNTDYSGTGLGLAITQRLVHMMEGEIEYSSRLGVGTTFKVVLPGVMIEEGQGVLQMSRAQVSLPPEGASTTEGTPGASQSNVSSARAERDARETDNDRVSPSSSTLRALHAGLVATDLPRWERLERTYLMHEIEAFASELHEKGRAAAYEPLREWSERLLRDARNFDMDQLPRTLNEFPGILAALNEQGNTPTSSSDISAHD